MTEHRAFLDFKAIKARVPLSSLLERYGVRLQRVNQSSLKGDCPLPSHSSKTRNSFYVNESKSVWYCHSESCKKNGNRAGGNLIDFVALMENLSVYDAARRLDELFPAIASPAGGNPSSAIVAPPVIVVPAEGTRTNVPLGFALKDVDHGHPMIIM